MDITLDAVMDTVRIVPFLFLCYLAMEALEHVAGDKTEDAVKRAGAWGPLIGSLLGALPQCGFSTAAATLYSGRVITLGTLIAVFLATSDEMIPIMVAEQAPLDLLVKILACKVLIGMAMGFAIDMFLRLTHRVGAMHFHIHEMCHDNDCECSHGIWRSALRHTLQVTLFVLAVSFALDAVMAFVGEDALAQVLASNPVLAVLASGTVGLIPNCAASVVITELYLGGALSTGAMMAGLLVSAGVGLLVLARANRPVSRTVLIVVLLWVLGVAWGFAFELAGITF